MVGSYIRCFWLGAGAWFLLAAAGGAGTTNPPPAPHTAEPEVLAPASIEAAWKYSVAHRGQALLILQNGRTLLEEYAGDSDRETKHRIFSGTKGFWTFAGLAATEDGLLRLDEPVSASVAVWKSDPMRADIPLRHVLDFTCGLAPDFPLHANGLSDRDRRALRGRLLASPGSAFIYGPAAMQVYHVVLKARLAAWKESPQEYLERRVLYPLGLGPQRYLPDEKNNPLLASGFTLTAREWAAFGRCLLQRGHPVLSRNLLDDVLYGSAANPAYSHGFWNNHRALSGKCREVDIEEMLQRDWDKQDWRQAVLCHTAPADLFASIGSAGQRLYVVPSCNLVVVRLSRDSKFTDHEFLRLLFSGPKGTVNWPVVPP